MRKVMRKGVTLLCCALFLNCGMAMVCSLYMPRSEPHVTRASTSMSPRWLSHPILLNGHATVVAWETWTQHGVGVSCSAHCVFVNIPPGDPYEVFLAGELTIACGWPSKCFQGQATYVVDNTWTKKGAWTDTPRNSFPFSEWRSVPFIPIWSGQIVNTTFFASSMALGMLGIGIIIRRVRTVRGRCRACGYPVGGDVCPECGSRHLRP